MPDRPTRVPTAETSQPAPPAARRSKGIPVLVLSGTIGSGKSTVADEVSCILDERGLAHALVDLDHLANLYPPPAADPDNSALAMLNLASIWPHYRAKGARRAVIARVFDSREQLTAYRGAIPSAEVTVVELRAGAETLRARIMAREMGANRREHLRRSPQLDRSLRRAAVADHVVDNDGRPLRAVAEEVLRVAGWI